MRRCDGNVEGHLGLAALFASLAVIPLAAQENHPSEAEGRIGELIHEGHYAEAEAAARALLKEAEGTTSAETLRTLDLLVESLYRGGKAETEEAIELADRVLSAKENLYGPRTPPVAASLLHRAEVHRQRLELEAARADLERALAIHTAVNGADHPASLPALSQLGTLLTEMGRYEDARVALERELALARIELSAGDPGLAPRLYNLARLLRRVGEYGEAQRDYERALEILVAAGQAEHPAAAYVLNGMATLNEERGEFTQARAQSEEALALARQTLGDDHPFVASCLNNLGYLLRQLGDYEEAARIYEEALALARKVHGPDHPYTASTLGNLAEISYLRGDLEEARARYEEVLATRERVLGEDHIEVATTLEGLGAVLRDLGERETATRSYERALAIARARIEGDHPDHGSILRGLAGVREDRGDLDGAAAAYEEALAITERTLGADNPAVADLLCDLAKHERRRGAPLEALGHALRAEEISRRHSRLMMESLPERQALRNAARRSSGLGLALRIAIESPSESSARAVWDSLVRSRALVLDEMIRRRRAVARPGDPATEKLGREYARASRVLANLVVHGPEDGVEAHLEAVKHAREDRERAERALADRSRSFRDERAGERVGLDDVRAALPENTGLVAFALTGSSPDPPATRDLVAFTLREGSAPTVQSLGSAETVQDLAARWRQAISRGAASPGGPSREQEDRCRAAGTVLREAIWDSVAASFEGARTVFVVPEGPLYLVSLAALPVGEENYVLERGPAIHYLSAERDLVAASPGEPRGEGLLVLGSPAFDDRSSFDTASARADGDAAGVTGSGFRSVRFEALPASGDEARIIAALWPDPEVVHLEGPAATEVAFKTNAPGKKALHLATHGFFLGRPSPGAEGTRGFGVLSPQRPEDVPPESALALSGLALAGANLRSAADPDGEDGILTAEEIAALDLTGVDWAVLSACDTGVGAVETGEGVLGLRRAFRLAGVSTLLMSLWAVEDEATRLWMEAFYDARLAGRSTVVATRDAGRHVLAQFRSQQRSTHPFYWAGFVAEGDWR